jgi:hypothetical protein
VHTVAHTFNMRFISHIAALALAATVSVSAQEVPDVPEVPVDDALISAAALSQAETNGIQTSCLLLTDYFVD